MRGIKTKEDKKWKKAAIFLVLLLMFGILLNSVNNIYQKKKAAQEALVRMQKEATELSNREEKLQESIARLDTTEGMNFEIRKKLNVAEAGESVAVIVDQKITTTTPPVQLSTWQKVKNFFSDLFK
jgi:cell division protein FtsB